LKKSSLYWRLTYAGITLVVGASVAALFWYVENAIEDRRVSEARSDTRADLTEVGSQLQNIAERSAIATRLLVKEISSAPMLDEAKFSSLAATQIEVFPEIRHVAAAPDLIVKFVYPLQGNETAIGLDYANNDEQRDAAVRAVEEEGIVLAGPVDLVQGGQAFISRGAVFVTDEVSNLRNPWGIVSVVLDAQSVYRAAGLIDNVSTEFAILGRDAEGGKGELFFGRAEIFEQEPVLYEVRVNEGSWTIGAVPVGGWSSSDGANLMVRSQFLGFGVVLVGFALAMALAIRQRLEARTQLMNAIDSIEDGFAYYDADDRLIVSNAKYRALYRLSEPAIKSGATFESILRYGVAQGQYPESAGREEEWIKSRMAAHRRADASLKQKLPDGTWLKINETRTPDGGVVGFRVDITELINAKEEAERANRAKSDFLNVMSHELRTPLSVVKGYATFLTAPQRMKSVRRLLSEIRGTGDRPASPQQAAESVIAEMSSYGQKIVRSADFLTELIDDVLDLSKIDAGKMILNLEEVLIDPHLKAVVGDFAVSAQEKGIALNFAGGVEGAWVRADSVRLRQVLSNLLSNAIKFTDEGSILVSSRLEDVRIIVEVTDTGRGIEVSKLEAIFERFSQIDSSSTRRAGGVGLGLSIARSIIEMHGGRIWAESDGKNGSKITFVLPTQKPS